VSKLYDGIFILHTSRTEGHDKGDWIFHSPYVIEAVMQIALASRKVHTVKIHDIIDHERRNGSKGQVVCLTGPEPKFEKNKNKQLEVCCARLPSPLY
jgi:myosin-1